MSEMRHYSRRTMTGGIEIVDRQFDFVRAVLPYDYRFTCNAQQWDEAERICKALEGEMISQGVVSAAQAPTGHGWVASETVGPNGSGYYTAGIDIKNTYGNRTHYSAIEFHSKDKATAERRRDAVLASSVSSTTRATPIMRAAENAAKVVDGWSDAKKDYAERVTASSVSSTPRGDATRERLSPEDEAILFATGHLPEDF